MESVSQSFSQAVQHHQGGNLRQAELLYRQILQIDPRHFDALHLLGLIAHQVGKNDLAVDYIRQAIRLHPVYARALSNLGNALRVQGKLEEAIASHEQALRLNPNSAEAHNNLGNVLRDQGKLREATTSFRMALRINPNLAEALNNLASALAEQENFDEAITYYKQALRVRPNYSEAHNNLGNALRDHGKDHGKIDEAIASYQQALRLKPDYADAHSNLGLALSELGRLDEAIASFREATRLQPKHAVALGHLANLLRGKLPDADRELIENRLAEADLNDSDRAKLLCGLAEVYDARGEYPQAAALLRRTSTRFEPQSPQKGQFYHLDESPRFAEKLMTAFTPAFFERVRGFGAETERPVFIVGLPRSGTTLTEQILAAHSQVYGAGELLVARKDFLALGAEPTDESVFAALSELPGDAIHRVAQRHLEQLEAMNRTAARVVDKMPNNYCYMGLLAALFPKAKFIHCRRDLRDVAVSCWMTPFVRWSKDPERIVARFRDYQRLMEHWRSVLPVSILEMRYEETVADLPGMARRLVEWCGLDWEPACLNFHEGSRPVRTPSRIQVREPIYTRSVGRWRHYEHELTELFAALKPLVESDKES
jgi:tetratricopeptide (TPR) repeat protein